MAWKWPWRKVEKRAAGSGYTAELIGLRSAYISGSRGAAELTATVETCVSLWSRAFAAADVLNAPMLDRRTMAMIARALALRGEALFIIDGDALLPCVDWAATTRNGRPLAYQATIADAGGGVTKTVLAGETLHFVLDADTSTPWAGTSPLRRARLTTDLLAAIESSLCEIFESAPIGSLVLPFPEAPEADMEALGRSFRGRRGKVLLRESVSVAAAGGPQPAADWRPQNLTPDLQPAMPIAALQAARASILSVYGVLPSWFDAAGQGPAIREAQRNLAAWHLQPVAEMVAEEASRKLGSDVSIDVLRPLQAFDQGGAARALGALVDAMARAKEANLPPEALASAFRRLDWER